MINKLFKSQYIIFYDQLLVSFSNFLIIILIQKLSGLFILGAFSFIWTFGLLIFSIQNSLILSPNFTEIKLLKQKEISQQITTIIIFELIFFLLIYFFLWIFFINFNLNYLYNLNFQFNNVYFSIFFFIFFTILKKVLFSLNKILIVLITDFLTYLLFFIIFFYFYKNYLISLETIFKSYLISFIIGTLILFTFIFKNLTVPKNFFLYLINLLKLGYPLLVSQIFQFFGAHYWFLCLGSIAGYTVLGVVRSITNLTQFFNIFFQFFENFYPSNWSLLYIKYGKLRLYSEIKSFLKFYFSVTLFCTLILITFSNELLKLIYNASLIEFNYIFQILLFLPILQMFQFPYQIGFRILKKSKYISLAYFWSALFSLFFAQYLIDKFNVNGFIAGMFVVIIIPITYMILKFYKES